MRPLDQLADEVGRQLGQLGRRLVELVARLLARFVACVLVVMDVNQRAPGLDAGAQLVPAAQGRQAGVGRRGAVEFRVDLLVDLRCLVK